MGIFMKRLTLTSCRHLHGLNHSLQYLLLLTVSAAGMACLDVGSAMPVCTLRGSRVLTGGLGCPNPLDESLGLS